MSLMKIYLRLLLFIVYVTDEGLAKIIIVRDICFRWHSWWKGRFMIRLAGIIELVVPKKDKGTNKYLQIIHIKLKIE
jgi:hypothetical protein